MTNSDTAIREFAENLASYCSTLAFMTEGDVKQLADSFHKPLTALISEHYVSKDEHEKTKHNLTHCGSCGDPLSRDCPRCKHLWES